MLKLNSELRAQAREALRGKWPMAAVAALIYSAIAGGLSAIPVIGGLCSLFVGLPVAYGFLFLQPYVAISRAAFYEDLKAQQGGSVEVNVEVNVEI